jgi:hypothetical protein
MRTETEEDAVVREIAYLDCLRREVYRLREQKADVLRNNSVMPDSRRTRFLNLLERGLEQAEEDFRVARAGLSPRAARLQDAAREKMVQCR